MESKKAVSGVITAVVLIALVIAMIAIVWTFVNSTVREDLDTSSSCFGNYDKITINDRFTCYDSSISGEENLRVSVSVGNVEVDGILVSISNKDSSKGTKILSEGTSKTYLSDSSGVYGNNVFPPGGGEGKIYLFNLNELNMINEPEFLQVEIAPIISGNQCDVSDSLRKIDNCLLLTS